MYEWDLEGWWLKSYPDFVSAGQWRACLVCWFSPAFGFVQWGKHEIAFWQNARDQYKWAVPGQMQVDMSFRSILCFGMSHGVY